MTAIRFAERCQTGHAEKKSWALSPSVWSTWFNAALVVYSAFLKIVLVFFCVCVLFVLFFCFTLEWEPVFDDIADQIKTSNKYLGMPVVLLLLLRCVSVESMNIVCMIAFVLVCIQRYTFLG